MKINHYLYSAIVLVVLAIGAFSVQWLTAGSIVGALALVILVGYAIKRKKVQKEMGIDTHNAYNKNVPALLIAFVIFMILLFATVFLILSQIH